LICIISCRSSDQLRGRCALLFDVAGSKNRTRATRFSFLSPQTGQIKITVINDFSVCCYTMYAWFYVLR
ncbi:hypothetical protein GOODEAATRI_023743, partial [Goodea atripinnis]